MRRLKSAEGSAFMQVAAARTALFPNCGWIIRCEILRVPRKNS
jgi:hypothetical protein